jgi:hypothetical protein
LLAKCFLNYIKANRVKYRYDQNNEPALQDSIFQAALLRGDSAIQAWDKWKKRVDLDGYLDNGSFWLLPVLYRNLQQHGINEPLMMKLKGVARQSWFRNQRNFRSLAPHLQALQALGISVMMLDGAALALQYPDYIRSFELDNSIFVKRVQAVEAIRQLRRLGWKPATRMPECLIQTFVSTRHMLTLKDQSGQTLHLFWQWLAYHYQMPDDDLVWKEAVTLELYDIHVFILSPPNQLLRIWAQGLPPRQKSRFLRAIDTMLTFRLAKPKTEWQQIAGCAQQHQLRPLGIETLAYLRDTLNFPPAADLLLLLNSTPTPPPGWRSPQPEIWSPWAAARSALGELLQLHASTQQHSTNCLLSNVSTIFLASEASETGTPSSTNSNPGPHSLVGLAWW